MIKPLAKSVLIPLELTTAASAVDAGIHKNVLGSGRNNNNNNNNNSTTTQIILNDEIEDIKRHYIRCKFIRKSYNRSRSDSEESNTRSK